MSSQERITVHNLADLKNTSDDAIPNFLNSLKFTQSHTLTDVRLALGYSAFFIAAACFAWDYQFGFEATKVYSAIAVTVYTLLNGALTLWIWLVEKGIVYQGTSPSGDKISIATSTKKNVPIYNLTVTVTSPKSTAGATTEVSRPFSEWFDSQGFFVAAPFQDMLATSIPVIGKLHKKPVKPAVTVRAPTNEYDPAMLDEVLEQSSNTTGAEAAAKKGSKRRKA